MATKVENAVNNATATENKTKYALCTVERISETLSYNNSEKKAEYRWADVLTKSGKVTSAKLYSSVEGVVVGSRVNVATDVVDGRIYLSIAGVARDTITMEDLFGPSDIEDSI